MVGLKKEGKEREEKNEKDTGSTTGRKAVDYRNDGGAMTEVTGYPNHSRGSHPPKQHSGPARMASELPRGKPRLLSNLYIYIHANGVGKGKENSNEKLMDGKWGLTHNIGRGGWSAGGRARKGGKAGGKGREGKEGKRGFCIAKNKKEALGGWFLSLLPPPHAHYI